MKTQQKVDVDLVRKFPVKGGTRKISDLPKPCQHPEHLPAMHRHYENGVYEHTCPGCGATMTFTVAAPGL